MKTSGRNFIVFVLCFTGHLQTIAPTPTRLTTKLGNIEGTVDDYLGKGKVYRFLKIPYAKPPSGNLRWRKPKPYGKWPSTLNAKDFGPMCPQVSSSFSSQHGGQDEDCLHLNIYIPRRISTNTSRSVMVWIHGGAYVAGSAIDYDGRGFVLDGDVILVTVNYRLSIFGFLANDDGSIPGNYGLWDQHFALQWIHDNIADYGGDPNSVTIFGESAGGGSVSFQSLYPGNQGLFQRVISQSGVATSVYLRRNVPNDMNRGETNKFIQQMNCTSNEISKSLDCLRNIPVNELLKSFHLTSSPAIDNDFVQGYAEDLLTNKSSQEYQFFTSLDYMVGALNGDGLIALGLLMTPDVLLRYNTTYENGLSTDILCQLIPFYVNMNVSATSKDICHLYSDNSSIQAQSNAIADVLTDYGFFYPAMESAKYHYRSTGQKASTYMYLMTRVNPLQYTLMSEWTPKWAQRATHAMDVPYLFNSINGRPLLNNSEDLSLMNSMRGYWTNFAKTG